MPENFDPFLDYEKLDLDNAKVFHKLICRQKRALDIFTQATPESPHFLKAAQTYVKAVTRSTNALNEIHHDIWTIPVMVHIAGEKKEETNPNNDDQTGILQRCSRCGSTLHLWYEGMIGIDTGGPIRLEEGDLPWWDVGAIVAKAQDQGGPLMYEVEKDRELEKHERMCVSLNDLIDWDMGDLTGEK